MKTLWTSTALVWAMPAWAAYQGPLVVRETFPVNAAPGERVTTQCQLWNDKVVRIVVAEGIRTRSERVVQVDTVALKRAIEATRRAPVSKQTSPTEGPNVEDTAVRVLPDDTAERVPLFRTYGGDGQSVVNTATEASGIRRLLDEWCR